MDEEIMEEIVHAHWNVFANQECVVTYGDPHAELTEEERDAIQDMENEMEFLEEQQGERMENLGLDIITLTKKLWGENSTDFVVGLMVTITTESQLEALLKHLLNQYIQTTKEKNNE